MAVRQIDESELLQYDAIKRAVDGMLANPESRKLVLQARKLSDPSVVIPELDAAAPIENELTKLRSEMAADREERARLKQEAAEQKQIEKFEAGWNRQKAALRRSGWSDEGIQAVEAHAQERGLGDLEVAAAHWEKLHPPAEPAQSSGSGSWSFFDKPAENDTFVKDMIESRGEDESSLNAEISAALRDFRGQTGARR